MKFVEFVAQYIGPFTDVLVKPFAEMPKVIQDVVRNNPLAIPIEAKGYIKIFTDPLVKIIQWIGGIGPDEYLDVVDWCKVNGFEILPLTNMIVSENKHDSRIAVALIGNKILENILRNVNGVDIFDKFNEADLGRQFSMMSKLLGPGKPFSEPLKVMVIPGKGTGGFYADPELEMELGDKLTKTAKMSMLGKRHCLGYNIVMHAGDNKLGLTPEELGLTMAKAEDLNASVRLKRGTSRIKFLNQILENKEARGISLEKEKLAWQTGVLEGDLLKILGSYYSNGKRVWNRMGIMSLFSIPMFHKSIFAKFKETIEGWMFRKLQPVDGNKVFGVGLPDTVLSEGERKMMKRKVVTMFPLTVRIACKATTKIANIIEALVWNVFNNDDDGDGVTVEKLDPNNLPVLDFDRDKDKIALALKFPAKEPMPAFKDKNQGIFTMLVQRRACGVTFNELIIAFVAAILAGTNVFTCVLAYMRGHSEFVESFIHGFKWKGGDRVRCARELMYILKLKGEGFIWRATLLMKALKSEDLYKIIPIAKKCNPNSKAVVERILAKFKGLTLPVLIKDEYVSKTTVTILRSSFVRFVKRDKDGNITRQYVAKRYRWLKKSISESAEDVVRNCLIRGDMRFAMFLIRIYKLHVPSPDIYFTKKGVI